ncbi:polysaccharide lyase family 8 protein [Cordyceps javanica]|uniref:Polysaccharide lyase family 8 protein n=1 Tax=Cordyceps javanica TaxID=43265 RepID=A0A545VWB1_9HYPO|nr:polysaccharide lyase family 8 protein [Cordyceps javanica]TQW06009.1 polysaccharide lyase family 8 protein [Cordyceps javanica]
MRLSVVTLALCALTCNGASVNTQDAQDMATLTRRRLADLAEFPDPSWFSSIAKWIDTQKPDGTWPDVNYLSGCPARKSLVIALDGGWKRGASVNGQMCQGRANWPIQDHWNRIITLAAAWSGTSLIADQKWTNDTKAWEAISNGLDYWFKNDYKPAACMGNGGNAALGCPCGTPGLWNTASSLALCNGSMNDADRPHLELELSYGTGGTLTAANVVLVLQSAVSLGLFTSNATIVESAIQRAFGVMTFTDGAMQDGIHRDGSFLQHDGILYNGNYGKDLLNIFIQLEGEANTIGRFVSYPTKDLQASADINFNVTKLARAVADFDGPYNVNDTIQRLGSNGTEQLIGNKGFWASDYMVHRRKSFIVANKMLSVRSTSSELVNGANPLGYHLGQGTLFTYVSGTEYEDIWASWDWNLVPGTTVVRDRPALAATKVKYSGQRDFVGVVSDGRVGVAVEDYADPFDGHISYKKAWFHLGDAVLVSVLDVRTRGVGGAPPPAITVLDNRAKADGGAFVDGKPVALGNDTRAAGRTLFYGGNGYLAYGAPLDLTMSEGERTGNWSAISTSTAGEATAAVFSAYMTVNASGTAATTYALFPATSQRELAREAERPSWRPVEGGGVSGAAGQGLLSVVFWPGSGDGGALTVALADIGWADRGTVRLTSRQPGVYLLTGTRAAATGGGPGKKGVRLAVSAADPTQKLGTATLELAFSQPLGNAKEGACNRALRSSSELSFVLPAGGMAGSSVQQSTFVPLV